MRDIVLLYSEWAGSWNFTLACCCHYGQQLVKAKSQKYKLREITTKPVITEGCLWCAEFYNHWVFQLYVDSSGFEGARLSLGHHSSCLPRTISSCTEPPVSLPQSWCWDRLGCPWQGWFPSPAVSWETNWLQGMEKGDQICLKHKRNHPRLCTWFNQAIFQSWEPTSIP